MPQVNYPAFLYGNQIIDSVPAPDVAAFPAPVGQSAGVWTGVFRDEFDTGSLDSTKWQAHYPSDGTIDRFHVQAAQEFINNPGTELQAYLPSGITFDADGLVLTATHSTPTPPGGSGANFSGLSYTSGMISSYPAFTLNRGFLEARCKCPGNDGSWPAFWMDRAENTWPPEIDIMEQRGTDAFTTVTVFKDTGGTQGSVFGQHVTVDATQWHVYAVRILNTSITWYLDGTQVAQSTATVDVPTAPMYVIANHAVNSNVPAGFPAAFHVDYIRVWQ